MNVQLLVYDLSQGLARQMSAGLLGFHLDAVYHTSIKVNDREYVYDGHVLSILPGSSLLGRPLQEIDLGKTEVPVKVIEEYIDSLRDIYTLEAYDLWTHNCNNFSNDLATFLLGKGIPEHIIKMPDLVRSSPFGQMLMPMLNQHVMSKKQGGGILGIQTTSPGTSAKSAAERHRHEGKVHIVSSSGQLDDVLRKYQNSCTVIFFTSATCPPCKELYPVYDELAAQVADKAGLIRVDISHAFELGRQYSISATPTFITSLRGQEESRWSGADPSLLRGNVQSLVRKAWPTHLHQSLDLPTFANPDVRPVLFTRLPSLAKLLAKLGTAAEHPAVQDVQHFLQVRSEKGPAEAMLPDVAGFLAFVRRSVQDMPSDLLFAVVDLLRCALIDPRVSSCVAEEKEQETIVTILSHANGLPDCPYTLRLVTLQLMCNLFSTNLYQDQILTDEKLRSPITRLISTSFLDDSHSNVRVAASSLLVNLAMANSRKRRDGPGDALPEGDQIELAASTLEAISHEESSEEALEGMLQALGYLAYHLALHGELADLLRSMDAAVLIMGKKKHFPNLGLVTEVGEELLGKGLKKS